MLNFFGDAERKYDLCKKLDPNNDLGSKKLIEEAEDNSMLYAEHTREYSSSVVEPLKNLVNELELKKSSFEMNGHTAISKKILI